MSRAQSTCDLPQPPARRWSPMKSIAVFKPGVPIAVNRSVAIQDAHACVQMKVDVNMNMSLRRRERDDHLNTNNRALATSGGVAAAT
jgi:hypothetical protein